MDRSEEWLKQIGKLVLPTQMIAAGLISGLLAFAVIAVAMRGGALLAAPGTDGKTGRRVRNRLGGGIDAHCTAH